MMQTNPRLGIFSLTGCGGDQLQLLNMEDKFLDLMAKFQLVDFQEGSSYSDEGNLDIAFVEGTVSTLHDLERLKAIRERTKILVAFGNCAVDGCIQSMRNGQTSVQERLKEIYGEDELRGVLEPKPLKDHVKVDYIIPGCPVEKDETLKGIASLLNGDSPPEKPYPVCVECKIREYPCVIVEFNKPCLGPIIRAGCGARCPSLNLDCIGCRGPVEGSENFEAELIMLRDRGYSSDFIIERLRLFSGKLPELPRRRE